MEEIIKNFGTAFKWFVQITCWTLSLISFGILVKNTYFDLLTGITVELIPEKSLMLPTLTFCLEEPFKSGGKVLLIKSCSGLIL
jgi:hypothetical protein